MTKDEIRDAIMPSLRSVLGLCRDSDDTAAVLSALRGAAGDLRDRRGVGAPGHEHIHMQDAAGRRTKRMKPQGGAGENSGFDFGHGGGKTSRR